MKTNINGKDLVISTFASHHPSIRIPSSLCSKAYVPDRYKESKYGGSEEKMKMYTTLMSAYGITAGIHYRFDGLVANTLHAHRLIQYYQDKRGSRVAAKIIDCAAHFRFPIAFIPVS